MSHRYSKEIRDRAIKMRFEDGLTYIEIGEKLGVSDRTVSSWCKNYVKEIESGDGIIKNEIEIENARLKSENLSLKKNNDILINHIEMITDHNR
ncbi:transposase [Peribacillus muralis]|uniref:transposase n=1 Tax=Peribacillus muralis TaxID=264697 RepID=UPI00382C55B1